MKLTLKEANLLMKNNKGNLDLCYTGIRELPEDLKVGGILDLSSTEIKEIPKSVDVGNIIGFLQYGCK